VEGLSRVLLPVKELRLQGVFTNLRKAGKEGEEETTGGEGISLCRQRELQQEKEVSTYPRASAETIQRKTAKMPMPKSTEK